MNERGETEQAQTSQRNQNLDFAGYFLYLITLLTALLQTFSAMLFPCKNNNK